MEEQKEQKPTAPPPSMSEAGFSINVKMIDPNGQEVMLTFRCALASHSAKLLQHYSGEVKALLEAGWSVSKAGSKAGNGSESPAAPKCKYHGSEMKPSKRPGSFFCPRKAQTESGYCDYKIEGGSN